MSPQRDRPPDNRNDRRVTAANLSQWGTWLICPACGKRSAVGIRSEGVNDGDEVVNIMALRLRSAADGSWGTGKLAGARAMESARAGTTDGWPVRWSCPECSAGLMLDAQLGERVRWQTQRLIVHQVEDTTS